MAGPVKSNIFSFKLVILLIYIPDPGQDLTAEVAVAAGLGLPRDEGGMVPDLPAGVVAGAAVGPRADLSLAQ